MAGQHRRPSGLTPACQLTPLTRVNCGEVRPPPGIALKISPETVRFTPQARSVAAELWRRAPRAMRAETLELAETVGILVGS